MEDVAYVAMQPETPASNPTAVLRVVEEDLTVRRERQETGRVHVSVEPQTVTRHLPLEWWTESTQVERRAVGIEAAERREPWFDGEILVVPVYEERLVVTRVLTLTEELRLRTVRTRHVETQEFPVREDRVHIERLEAAGPAQRDEPSTPPSAAPFATSFDQET